MKKIAAVVFTLVSLLLCPLSPEADTRSASLLSPLPAAETALVLERWFTGRDFMVSHPISKPGLRHIYAQRQGEQWDITVKPCSPLASILTAEYTLQGMTGYDKLNLLSTVLKKYTERNDPEGVSPDASLHAALSQYAKFVVYIRGGRESSFLSTGFIVGSQGLVISTAHGLGHVRNVTVVLNNGRKVPGRIDKIDIQKDLSLIDIGMNIDSTISLNRSRYLLDLSDKVYSMGYYDRQGAIIKPGVVNRHLGLAGSLPLWQVNMEVTPGRSGSPVFDEQGNLVGIVKGRYRGEERRGFLITMGTVMEFLSGV